jgi:hypothetical protein
VPPHLVDDAGLPLAREHHAPPSCPYGAERAPIPGTPLGGGEPEIVMPQACSELDR